MGSFVEIWYKSEEMIIVKPLFIPPPPPKKKFSVIHCKENLYLSATSI